MDEQRRDQEREDELLARLRGADPAATVEVSAGFAAAVLAAVQREEAVAGAMRAAQRDEDAGGADDRAASAAAGSDTPPPLDLAAARERRRPRWWTVAASAAAAAVIGVGGYAAGSGGFAALSGGGQDSSTMADSPQRAAQDETGALPGPISLTGDSSSADGAGAGEESQAAAQSAADSASSSQYLGRGAGRHAFTGSGFATAEGTATVYGLDPMRAGEETARHLADVLGVSGEPRLEYGTWSVGAADGNGPLLNLGLDGTASMTYTNYAADPLRGCWEMPNPEVDSDDAWQEYSRQQEECVAAADAAAPSADAAVAELTRLLPELGLDPAGFTITGTPAEYSGSATATATRLVDDQRTDLTLTLGLGPEGIASIWGSLAELTDLGAYPIVSESTAIERLSDPRFGAINQVWPLAVDLPAQEEWEPPTQAPPAPTPGTAVDWAVAQVDLVSVRLGLAQHYQNDGSVLLVPAYEFTDSDGGTWSVLALAEGELSF